MLSPEIMNELENISENKKLRGRQCFSNDTKLHVILQNFERYRVLEMLLRMIYSRWM